MKVGRNDPCPCGSGLKHKRCCLSPEQISESSTAPTAVRDDAPARPAWQLPAIVAGVSIAAGILIGVFVEPTAGIAVTLALGLLGGVFLIIDKAPKSTGRHHNGHAGIGFGRSRRSKKRPRNRRERRSDG